MKNLVLRFGSVLLLCGFVGGFSVFAENVNGRVVNVASVEGCGQWQQDVRLRLSDAGNDCKFLKKIEIFGVPDDYCVYEIRIESSLSGYSSGIVALSSDENCGKNGVTLGEALDRQLSSAISFDEDRKCYEVLFNPCLYHGDRINSGDLNLDGYFVNVFYKKRGSSGSHATILEFEVSNDGLKKPDGFEELRNFAVDYDKQSGRVRVKGIPRNVDSLCLKMLYLRVSGNDELKGVISDRDKDGNFYFKYKPKKSGKYIAMLCFTDDSGFRVNLDGSFDFESC